MEIDPFGDQPLPGGDVFFAVLLLLLSAVFSYGLFVTWFLFHK